MICDEIVTQVTKKEAGVYRAMVCDGRGEDESILEFVDSGEKSEPGFLSNAQSRIFFAKLKPLLFLELITQITL